MDKCIHGFEVKFVYTDRNQFSYYIECKCPICRKKEFIVFECDNNESMDRDVH